MTIYTIGVYGWGPQEFARALTEANITSLVDIRRRRGVRGAAHAFANAKALERLVTSEGMKYIPEVRLAPTLEIRALQKKSDQQAGASKTTRSGLSENFVQAYRTEILGSFSPDLLDHLLENAGERPAFLCVEREAAACHRGILADWLAAKTHSPIVNLLP